MDGRARDFEAVMRHPAVVGLAGVPVGFVLRGCVVYLVDDGPGDPVGHYMPVGDFLGGPIKLALVETFRRRLVAALRG